MIGQEIEGLIEVPCLALAENSWFKLKETREFCEMAVQRKGAPFRDLAKTVGDKTKSASFKCKFNSGMPIIAHYVQFSEVVQV